MSRNYQSYQGPTDPNLRHSEIEGYQPVSRIGEIVINSFGTPCIAQTCTHTHTNTHRISNQFAFLWQLTLMSSLP